MAETSSKKLQCVVVTPETTVLDQPVDFIAVPLYDGELGILPGRAPLVARLGYGELRARVGGAVSRHYIDGGFLQVTRDVVTVLSPRAIPADRVDVASTRRDLDEANRQVPSNSDAYAARSISIARARGKLRVASHAAKS